MLESIGFNENSNIKVSVLAMDSSTEIYLKSLKNKYLTIYSLDTFPDYDFNSLVGVRPFRELCWTAASCLTNFVYHLDQNSDFIVYVDADCYFFSKFEELVETWKPDKEIFIHEHRFTSSRAQWATTAGRFNVGVVGFRNFSLDAQDCLALWRSQVIEVCELDPSRGLCGDQGYLNSWPDKYSSVQIMEGAGMGAAPWNIEGATAHEFHSSIEISNERLYFYHFHALKPSFSLSGHLLWTQMAHGYKLDESHKQFIYKKYLQKLKKNYLKLMLAGFQLDHLGAEERKLREYFESLNTNQNIYQMLI